MNKFDIFTDSSCDLNADMIEKYDLKVIQLEVNIDDKPPVLNNQIEIKEFYIYRIFIRSFGYLQQWSHGIRGA